MEDRKREPGALILQAIAARDNAHVPYSKFRVGAAVQTGGEKVYTGCNIENASYGLTCCAERVAVFKAVSEGEKHFIALAVVSDSEKYCSPCGACRQVLAEFGDEILIYMANNNGQYRVKKISELLPDTFRLVEEE